MNLADAIGDLRRAVKQRARMVTGSATTDAEWTVAGGTLHNPVVAPALALQGDVAYAMPTPSVVIVGEYNQGLATLADTGTSGADWEPMPSADTNDSLWTWTAPHDGWLHVSASCRIGYMTATDAYVEHYLNVDCNGYRVGDDYVATTEFYTRELNIDTPSYDFSLFVTRSVWLRAGVPITPQLYYRKTTGDTNPRAGYVRYGGVWIPGPRPARIVATDGGAYP